MNISYDSYRVFYYAAKYRSFSQAAAALYSNQPNVTRMIRKLESELGCALFKYIACPRFLCHTPRPVFISKAQTASAQTNSIFTLSREKAENNMLAA